MSLSDIDSHHSHQITFQHGRLKSQPFFFLTRSEKSISKGSEATKHHQQATCQKKKKLLEKTMIPMPTLLYVCMESELGWKPPAWLLWWEKDLILKLLRFTYKLLLHKLAPGLSTSFSTAKSGATKSALMTREDCYYASIFGAHLGSHPHCWWIPPSPRREDCWCVYCHVGFIFSMHAASSSKSDGAVWSLNPGNLLAKLQACFAMQQMH